jgi:hypothetical protein
MTAQLRSLALAVRIEDEIARRAAAVSIAAGLARDAAGRTAFRSMSRNRFSIAGASRAATSSRLSSTSTAWAFKTQSRIWPGPSRQA